MIKKEPFGLFNNSFYHNLKATQLLMFPNRGNKQKVMTDIVFIYIRNASKYKTKVYHLFLKEKQGQNQRGISVHGILISKKIATYQFNFERFIKMLTKVFSWKK